MCTPSKRNAEEKCLIKEKFQRELSGPGKEKTKRKQDKINKDPLTGSARPSCIRHPRRQQGQLLPSWVSLLGGEGILPENPSSTKM